MSTAQDFCFWSARSQTDTIAIIIKQVVVITVFFMATNNIRIHLFVHNDHKTTFSSRTKNLLAIFSLIILWALFQSIQHIYSIVIYFKVVFPMDADQDIDMTQYSIVYAFLDFFPGFIVQTLFIFIPYVFIKNILDQLPVQIFKNLYELKLKSFVQFWIIARVLVHFSLATIMLLVDQDQLSFINIMDVYFLIGDEFIIFIIILLCKKWYINKVKSVNFKIYYLIIITSALRISTDLFFLIIFQDDEQQNCISQFSQHLNYSIGSEIFGAIINHYCPIFTILFLYKYSQPKQQTLIEEDDITPSFVN